METIKNTNTQTHDPSEKQGEPTQPRKPRVSYEEFAKKKTVLPVKFLTPVFLVLMVCVPFAAAIFPVLRTHSTLEQLVSIGVAPITFGVLSFIVAGLLSVPFHAFIVSGKFPRKITHYVYGPRRLYGLCWGAVFYNTPVYFAIMSTPILRTFMLRLFGYKGHSDVTLAPDAWLRDLPLLKLEKGVYIANKATMGTNMCLADGSIFVDAIHMGENAMVGHLTMIAPGCKLKSHVEIGVGCAIGLRVSMGEHSSTGPTTTLNHGCRLGKNVEVGTMSFVGVKTIIEDGLKLPGGSNVPAGSHLRTQSDIESFISSETKTLKTEAANYAKTLAQNSHPRTATSNLRAVANE